MLQKVEKMQCDISTAKSTIIQRNKPVILVDTCALIDIIRIPHRLNIKISHLEGAKEIFKKVAKMELSIVLNKYS